MSKVQKSTLKGTNIPIWQSSFIRSWETSGRGTYFYAIEYDLFARDNQAEIICFLLAKWQEEHPTEKIISYTVSHHISNRNMVISIVSWKNG